LPKRGPQSTFSIKCIKSLVAEDSLNAPILQTFPYIVHPLCWYIAPARKFYYAGIICRSGCSSSARLASSSAFFLAIILSFALLTFASSGVSAFVAGSPVGATGSCSASKTASSSSTSSSSSFVNRLPKRASIS